MSNNYINPRDGDSEKSLLPQMKWEFFSPLWMFIVLVFVSAFYSGILRDSKFDVTLYGTQARVAHVCAIVFWMHLYLHEWGKIRLKIYRVFTWSFIFVVLMLLGCHFIPWWNVWMGVPLTAIWYPIHYRILKNLPRRESDDKKE
jgi:hypothetical protein